MFKKNQMVLLVTDSQLLELIQVLTVLTGWQQLSVRHACQQDGHEMFTVNLDETQARVLGQAKVREVYSTEYAEPPVIEHTQPIPAIAPAKRS
jgi:hypothetical protein